MTFKFSTRAKGLKFIKDHPSLAKKYGIQASTIERFLKGSKKKEK